MLPYAHRGIYLRHHLQRKIPTTPDMPGYFRFLTLMAFHSIFLDKKVDATILEVGIGGTYDSTIIAPSPFVTGITAPLGIDHIQVLCKTIQDIACQKSDIFKVNSNASFAISSETLSREMFLPSLSLSQRKPGLEARAMESKVCFVYI